MRVFVCAILTDVGRLYLAEISLVFGGGNVAANKPDLPSSPRLLRPCGLQKKAPNCRVYSNFAGLRRPK